MTPEITYERTLTVSGRLKAKPYISEMENGQKVVKAVIAHNDVEIPFSTQGKKATWWIDIVMPLRFWDHLKDLEQGNVIKVTGNMIGSQIRGTRKSNISGKEQIQNPLLIVQEKVKRGVGIILPLERIYPTPQMAPKDKPQQSQNKKPTEIIRKKTIEKRNQDQTPEEPDQLREEVSESVEAIFNLGNPNKKRTLETTRLDPASEDGMAQILGLENQGEERKKHLTIRRGIPPEEIPQNNQNSNQIPAV